MSSSDKPTRREFLVTSSSVALGAAIPSTVTPPESNARSKSTSPYAPEELLRTGPQRTFTGMTATQVAMPVGGIGAGCICFNEGPFPVLKIFDQGLQGEGYRRGGFEGFPRFQKCEFNGEFPFGEARISDSLIPLEVKVTAWNPFIPLDDKNSSIPCAILEYSFHNTSKQPVEFEFSYHLSHLAPGCGNDEGKSRNTVLPGRGVFLHNAEESNSESFGSACLMAIGSRPKIKGMWLRSPGWEFDSLSALWREVSTGKFTENQGTNDIDTAGRNGGSILFEGKLAAGESRTYPLVIAWHFPNCYLQVGGVSLPGEAKPEGGAGCRILPDGKRPLWRPFYASIWQDAREVADYVQSNYPELRGRTVKFKDALFSSTLPSYVLDAVSANLAIIKSPTVLRVENGDIWGWEGCFPDAGCCHGSCTHVWNYAQAFPHLFPKLERSLRELELIRSMDDRGHVTFRSALPEGPVPHDFHAASDGQLGGIMKVFREWQISGDLEWMRKMYPLAKRSLDYCIRTWDPDRRGGLFEPHHNTYDIEFWGPDGMCTSVYLGALSALAGMARALGNTEDETSYAELSQRSARFMDEQLFSGEYYQQRVEYAELRDQSFAKMVARVDQNSGEMQRLLKREGPKYQYGTGCLSDGVIGVWMARMYGIETPLSQEKVRSSLEAIFRHNFKADLSQHANAQRPGYAMGHEPGLLLCTWPRGNKPTLPFVYSDEVWTGIEYQVASHLIAEGLVREGLTIVKAVRSRYDGRARNPWNEYECGNYYARAMASYALMGSLSGFRYSAAQKMLWFGPKLSARPFKTFFSAASGFGTITLDHRSLRIDVIEGELPVEKLILSDGTNHPMIDWKTTARPGSPAVKNL